MSRLGVICGGSGSSKFASALDGYFEGSEDLGFICNVADNFWFHGLYVCPDIDIITYALSHKLDRKKGWGIHGDTRNFLKGLGDLGCESWFALGDQDLALSVLRTELSQSGLSLSSITDRVRKSFGIVHSILPSSDNNVETLVETSKGKIHLQEFWVKLKGTPSVRGVDYAGIKKASPSPAVLNSLSHKVLVLPANPVTSILPTVNLKGVRKSLSLAKNVVAISPFIGKTIFSGPGAKLMRATGVEPSSYGVAKLYSDFLKVFMVDRSEESSQINRIKQLGIECIRSSIKIATESDKKTIAREIKSAI